MKRWTYTFGKNRIKIFFAEDLQQETKAKSILHELEDYLEISHYDYQDQLKQKFDVAPPSEMPDDIRKRLEAFFNVPNQQLATYLGRSLPWA